jgi:hypothetical protein
MCDVLGSFSPKGSDMQILKEDLDSLKDELSSWRFKCSEAQKAWADCHQKVYQLGHRNLVLEAFLKEWISTAGMLKAWSPDHIKGVIAEYLKAASIV